MVLPADSDMTAMTAKWTDGVLGMVILDSSARRPKCSKLEVQ